MLRGTDLVTSREFALFATQVRPIDRYFNHTRRRSVVSWESIERPYTPADGKQEAGQENCIEGRGGQSNYSKQTQEDLVPERVMRKDPD